VLREPAFVAVDLIHDRLNHCGIDLISVDLDSGPFADSWVDP
jgi:hypothetical protein